MRCAGAVTSHGGALDMNKQVRSARSGGKVMSFEVIVRSEKEGTRKAPGKHYEPHSSPVVVQFIFMACV